MPVAVDSLPLSALNHFLYCSRRAYLIHAERVFVDNEHTSGARIETPTPTATRFGKRGRPALTSGARIETG